MIHRMLGNSRARCWIAVLGLVLVAALPRFYDLGGLGFYGDEETTALPARALVTTGNIEMPSGMPYYRALPLTYLNALTANVLGIDRELSYRLPAAIFGTLTIPLLFLLARPLVGDTVAFTAAMMLALSEWHIITSREARMYAPFILFYMLGAFTVWRWARFGGVIRLAAAAVCVMAAIAFHSLGILAVLFPLLALAFPGWTRIPAWPLLVFALVTLLGAQAYNDFVESPFIAWTAIHGHASTGPDAAQAASAPLPASWQALLPYILAGIVGAAYGLWIAYRMHSRDHEPGGLLRTLGRYGTSAVATAATISGQLYGAAIAWMVYLLLHPADPVRDLRKTWPWLLPLPIAAVAWLTVWTVQGGPVYSAKRAVMFPYPYIVPMGEMLQGVLLLSIAALVMLVFRHRLWNTDAFGLRASALSLLLPLAAVGLASRWGGLRYLSEAYPFLLLLGAFALIVIINTCSSRIHCPKPLATAGLLAVVIVASGLLGGHGVPQAWRVATADYTTHFDPHALGFPVYPDHRDAGIFVRERLLPDDIVVAEDMLEQHWYVGRVDYWLRDGESHRRFLYRASDGELRDIYVNSRILDHQTMKGLIEQERRVWIITSAETRHARDFYLDSEQQSWLNSLESLREPVFTAPDGLTRVYCVGCDSVS